MSINNSVYKSLANRIALQFTPIFSVKAIALGGSQSSGVLDSHSDIDLYIFSNEAIPLSARQAIVEKLGASKADLNLTFWDLGDEWYDLETGIEIDVIYWDQRWIEDQLDRSLVFHQARMGYSTCFWRTVVNAHILFDREGWLVRLQEKCTQPYPEQLKKSIIAKNYPVLRDVIPSYYTQIKKALERQDIISINHRLAAFLVSYFDVLFAVNEVMHPGEKKIIDHVLKECSKVPVDIELQVEVILRSAARGDAVLLPQLDTLIDGLDAVLVE